MSKEKPWQWFHTFHHNGELEFQGVVLVVLPNGDLRVQLFSFLTGEPTEQEVWGRDDLPEKRMRFYETNQEMLSAYTEYQARQPPL